MMEENKKFEPKQKLSKNWKPCKTELTMLKKKVDKLAEEYSQRKALGQHMLAKRIFKKAMRLTDRISLLLGFDGRANHQVKVDGGKTNAKQVATIKVE